MENKIVGYLCDFSLTFAFCQKKEKKEKEEKNKFCFFKSCFTGHLQNHIQQHYFISTVGALSAS